MNRTSPEQEVKTNRDAIDDYLGSIYGLRAFITSALWDSAARRQRPEGKSSTQRRMTLVRGETPKEVTPDGVVQVHAEYGIVVEMKKHFAPDQLDHLEQVKKYDEPMQGWWTGLGTIPRHDLVLLVHYFSKTRAVDALAKWKASGNSFSHPFAIVCFTHSQGGQEYFALERAAGSLSDTQHDEALRNVRPIPNRVLKEILSGYKFYDAPPPVMHTMILLMDYIVPTIVREEVYDQVKGTRRHYVEMTVNEAQEELGKYCQPPTDSRDAKLPRREWVEEALESLVSCKVAERIAGQRAKYRIGVSTSPKKRDTLNFLAERLFRKKGKPEAPMGDGFQDELFG
jgi:hypothetical protein